MAAYDSQLAGYLVDLTKLEQPLAAGLRALADDVSVARQAGDLRALAGELEQGKSLPDALQVVQARMPAGMARLLQVGLESGQAGPALEAFVEQQRRLADLRFELRRSLAYPLLVLLLLVPVVMAFLFLLVPMLEEIYTEFELELPENTELMLLLGDVGMKWTALLAAVLAGGMLLVRFLGGKGAWHRLRSAVPLIGPVFVNAGLAELCLVLGELIERGMPLPAALRFTAQSLSNANLGNVCAALAGDVESGIALPQALADSPECPPTLVALANWGTEHNQLPRALAIAGDEFEERARIQTELLRGAVPPVLFLFAAGTMVFLLTASLVPLVKLISWLT